MRSQPTKRLFLLGLALLALLCADGARSQEKPKPKLPTPKPLILDTKDGLALAAIYYPSERGKEAVPVMLLHDWGGSGADFKPLAEYLQGEGHAVLVPDLRGHGDSTTLKGGKELDHSRMPVAQCHSMYKIDVEACKNYLIKENNAQKLNIEKLCVVGAGLGALVAMNWAVIDWSWPPIAGQKQGQDVKALVLLSPPWTQKSVSVNNVIKHPALLKELTLYIVVGTKGPVAADAGKINKRLDTAREGDSAEAKKLHWHPIDTNRQGIELLVPANFKMLQNIQEFIKVKLQNKAIEWKERKNPLE